MTITALMWGMVTGAIMAALALATLHQSTMFCSLAS